LWHLFCSCRKQEGYKRAAPLDEDLVAVLQRPTETIMYTRLLIPLDGSKNAEQVLPYGRFLAKQLAIPVELLGIIDPLPLADFAEVWERSNFDNMILEETRITTEYLQATARSFGSAKVKWTVEKGAPAEVIIENAAAEPKTLIVMATHGRSGVQRWLLGSVADKVLHGTSNHLFLVRASGAGETEGEAVLKTVVVPLDGSALAENAFSAVEEVAAKLELEVVLIRAYALPPAAAADEYGTYTQQAVAQLETEAREYLSEKAQELKSKGISHVATAAELGYGAEEIIALARRTPDNFIAMCTHGRSGLRRWLLGSVTERVVRHSGDPVLIVAPRE
jgi:nucleotide-binding universal stress UspA family protein